MRPFWTRRAVELLPEPVGSRPEGKTIHVTPPAEPEHVAQSPMTDADRAELWKRTAETRRIDNLNLRDENDRLRADLALARDLAAVRPAPCGHEATLRRHDEREARCRAEHVDRDELERRVGAATGRWPF